MRKSVEKEKEVLDLGEVTKLYATYALQEKEAKKGGEKYKKMILDYASENRGTFGKTLELPNGVKVEVRSSEKAKWNDNKISVQWLSMAIDAELGDAISVDIDAKEIGKIELDADQMNLLSAIEYESETKESMAVYVN